AINQLAEPYRKVIEYYYFYELNDRLISIMLGVSRSTVQSRRSKALGWLREDLEESSDVCNTNS
ncbi:MAG: sigma factor-like helix-turn-helix DNA-binding protein, partial [Syntrophorhabdus sp.]